MQKETKDFLKKELRITIVFFFITASAKFLPELFSFSGKSSFYETYYHESVPIGFLDLLIILFFVRLVIRFLIFFIQHFKTPAKKKQ
jgi:hypothetical protein